MKKLNNLKYGPVGHCIYCGSTQDLEKEHILPFGLSGTAVLPDSTCRQCAAISGEVEQAVLRGPMWAVRVYRDLKSRTKHKDAPKGYPLTVVKGGQEINIEVPIADFPILLHFPIFAPPGYLDPSGYKNGIRVSGVATISFGPRPEEIAKKLGVEKISINQDQKPAAFARMIAKIAYAWAAAERKLDRIADASFVVSAILGKTDDIGQWVGTLTDPMQKYEGLLHRILVHEDNKRHLLIAEVHLFSDSQAPKYGVILGQLKSQ